MNDVCHAMCRKFCEPFRDDLNPCEDGQLCVGASPDGPWFCDPFPVVCRTASDCPMYRPPDDAGIQSDWTCEDGTCQYPGYVYGAE
jgi:hypothetical protein